MNHLHVTKTTLEEIKHFRALFLDENNFQFVHDKCHLYGWADTYVLKLENVAVGYGSVWGNNKREDRDTIFEFYIIKPHRKFANAFFEELLVVSDVAFLECQTNDNLLSKMFFEYAQNINTEAILFKELFQTNFKIHEIVFEKLPYETGARKDELKYVLKLNEDVIATGGLFLNYNFPYADLYYEVNAAYRKQGHGTYFIQELKKAAYAINRVPAARCNTNNQISKLALLKAGFTICGHLLVGEVKK